MALHPDVEAVMHELAAAASSGRNLPAALNDFLVQASKAVPSCLAVSLTLTRYGLPVMFTVRSDQPSEQTVRSSLAVQLPSAVRGPDRPSTVGESRSLTLYASTPDAFGPLAADVLALLDLDPRRAIIDGHLELPAVDHAGVALRKRLDDLSDTDLALGALLDKGLLPDAGRRELERLAAVQQGTVADAARAIVAAVRRPQPDS